MAYAALAEYLEQLASCGQLVRVAAEVDPAGEIAEITRRVARRGGPALLFERVRGQSMAVATNVLGTEARVCQALDVESLDAIIPRIEALIREHTPQNWFERLKTSDDAAGVNKFRPKSVKAGPCQQVVRLGRDVDLGLLPLVKQSPGDARTALLGGQLITQALGSEQRSASRGTLLALEPNRMAVVALQGGAPAQHWAEYRRAAQRMPLAVVVGGDPACVVAANLELPPGIDCDQLAGLLRGRAVDLVKCRTHGIDVPADAELIIEGYLDPETPDVAVASDNMLGGQSTGSGVARGGRHASIASDPVDVDRHGRTRRARGAIESARTGAVARAAHDRAGRGRPASARARRAAQLRVRFRNAKLSASSQANRQRPVGQRAAAIHQVSGIG